jgi:hypothetical protein
MKDLRGTYVFGEFVSGKLFGAFRTWDGKGFAAKEVGQLSTPVSGFLQTETGDLFAVAINAGKIFRLTGGPCVPDRVRAGG